MERIMPMILISFDPRPRVSGDIVLFLTTTKVCCFDPRPRVRGDGTASFTLRNNTQSAALREPVRARAGVAAPRLNRDGVASIYQRLGLRANLRLGGASLPVRAAQAYRMIAAVRSGAAFAPTCSIFMRPFAPSA